MIIIYYVVVRVDTDWKFTERAVGRCVMGVIGLRLRPKRTGCGAGAAGANLKSAFVVGQNFALGKLLLNSMVLFLSILLPFFLRVQGYANFDLTTPLIHKQRILMTT